MEIPNDYGSALKKIVTISSEYGDQCIGDFRAVWTTRNRSLSILLNRLRLVSGIDKAEIITKANNGFKYNISGLDYLFKYLGLRYTTPPGLSEGEIDIKKSLPYLTLPIGNHWTSVTKTSNQLHLFSENNSSIWVKHSITLPYEKARIIGKALARAMSMIKTDNPLFNDFFDIKKLVKIIMAESNKVTISIYIRQ